MTEVKVKYRKRETPSLRKDCTLTVTTTLQDAIIDYQKRNPDELITHALIDNSWEQINCTYGTLAGTHTPEKTFEYLKELRMALPRLDFVDASWHNDAADSFEIENFKITLPDGAGLGQTVNKYRLWVPNPGEGEAKDDYTTFVLETTRKHTENTCTEFRTIRALVNRLLKINK